MRGEREKQGVKKGESGAQGAAECEEEEGDRGRV